MKDNKHFTADERHLLFQRILEGNKRIEIAKELDKSTGAITYELETHRVLQENRKSHNNCGNQEICEVQHLCNDCYEGYCKGCTHNKCNDMCSKYLKEPNCKRVNRFPLVCNGCEKIQSCKMNKWYYSPNEAQKQSDFDLVSSRSHPQLSKVEIEQIEAFAAPLITKGISPDVVVAELKKQPNLPHISVSTFYRYIGDNAFSFRNIDLKAKVKRRCRRKKSEKAIKIMNNDEKIGRFYEDFLKVISDQQFLPVWELDTVEGKKGQSAVMTLLDRRSNFMLIFKIKKICSEEIIGIFNTIKKFLGAEIFKATFPIILTDNGKEFIHPIAIEADVSSGERLIQVYFCQPRHSEQKGKIEKNHEHLREIVPKGISMDDITQADINLISLHVNSYPRKILGMKSPFQIEKVLVNEKVLLLNRLRNPLPLDKLNLKPDLLKRTK